MAIQVKKSFTEIYNILVEASEKGKLVSDVLEDILPIMESKQRDINHRYNADGELEIFCYYHKEWENTAEIEYGNKANSTTGLNTMCKIGVNCWTKQQRDYKVAKGSLLDQISEGKLDIANLSEELEKLEAEKNKIISRSEYLAMKEAEEQEEQEAEEEDNEE